MIGPNYFKVLSLIYGALLILRIPLTRLIMGKQTVSVGETGFSDRKSGWTWPLGILVILLVLFTWYVHARSPVDFSWVVTLAVTITGYKTVGVLFSHRRFRELGERETGPSLTYPNMVFVAVGVLLVLLGIFVY
jgi:hypothetical protein